jgi:hypothetical protein
MFASSQPASRSASTFSPSNSPSIGFHLTPLLPSAYAHFALITLHQNPSIPFVFMRFRTLAKITGDSIGISNQDSPPLFHSSSRSFSDKSFPWHSYRNHPRVGYPKSFPNWNPSLAHPALRWAAASLPRLYPCLHPAFSWRSLPILPPQDCATIRATSFRRKAAHGVRSRRRRILTGVNMLKTRRTFLQWLAPFAASTLVFPARLPAQRPNRGMPNPPPPADPSETLQQNSGPHLDRRLIVEQHEKDFRQTLDHLYDLVRQLKLEVENTPTSQVFSVKIYKQTQEIEKLAKRLKSRAKS